MICIVSVIYNTEGYEICILIRRGGGYGFNVEKYWADSIIIFSKAFPKGSGPLRDVFRFDGWRWQHRGGTGGGEQCFCNEDRSLRQ